MDALEALVNKDDQEVRRDLESLAALGDLGADNRRSNGPVELRAL